MAVLASSEAEESCPLPAYMMSAHERLLLDNVLLTPFCERRRFGRTGTSLSDQVIGLDQKTIEYSIGIVSTLEEASARQTNRELGEVSFSWLQRL